MIRSIDKIDDVKMEFSIQITFRSAFPSICNSGSWPRQKWFDDRLRFADKISPEMQDKIKYLTITEPGKVSSFLSQSDYSLALTSCILSIRK
jgi:hypothetical protein